MTRKATHQLVAIICLFLTVTMAMQAAAQQRVVEIAGYFSDERWHIYEAFFKAFEEKTGIKANVRRTPSGQVAKWEQVIVQIAGAAGPDIVTGTSVEFVQYAASGLLQPLDTFIAREAERLGTDPLSVTIDFFVEQLQWRGKQYMLPYGVNGVALVYNQDLYDAAGLQPPPDEWNDPRWTWEQFVSDMQRLTIRTADGVISQFGLAGPYWDSWITLPYNWGGDWVDLETNRFMGTEPEAIASVESLRELRWEYHVMPQPGEPYGGEGGFLTGTAALTGMGTWGMQKLIDSGQPMRFAPWFKVGDHRPAGVINPMGVAMLASAKNKEEAWEFIKFTALDPVGNALWARAAGATPMLRDAQLDWMHEFNALLPGLGLETFLQQVVEYPAIVNIRKVTTFNDINAVMVPAVNDVLNNITSAEVAMNQVAPIVQMLIDAGDQ